MAYRNGLGAAMLLLLLNAGMLVWLVVFPYALEDRVSAPYRRGLDVELRCDGSVPLLTLQARAEIHAAPDGGRILAKFQRAGLDRPFDAAGCTAAGVVTRDIVAGPPRVELRLEDGTDSRLQKTELAEHVAQAFEFDLSSGPQGLRRIRVVFEDVALLDPLLDDRWATDLAIRLAIADGRPAWALDFAPDIFVLHARGQLVDATTPDLIRHRNLEGEQGDVILSAPFEALPARYGTGYASHVRFEMEDVGAPRRREGYVILWSTLLGIAISVLFEILWSRRSEPGRDPERKVAAAPPTR